MFIRYFLAVILLFSVGTAYGQWSHRTSILTWNANVESDVAGYKIYRSLKSCATSVTTDFTLLTTVGIVTTYTDAQIPLTALSVCYDITAFDTSGNESKPSNTVGKVTHAAPSAPTAPSFK